MKIEGPQKTSGTKGASKPGAKKSAGDTAFSGMVGDTDETAAASAAGGAMAIQSIDSLLSLQGAEDGTSEGAARKARQRGQALLDQLDKVRIGLLTGEIPVSTLRQLTHTINMHRAQVMDPKLMEILDEIDLRAQVEMAKLQKD